MREFKEIFESLGYTFQSAEVLEDVYVFYKYYDNKVNEGVSAILLEGDPGSGKTYLSKVYSKFMGEDTEYLYTQCVEETNSERLIATYNVPAIVKGDADKSIAEGILTKAIKLANEGKKVVLTIDELDKAREALDSYFLDFLQNGKIETSDNEILALTEEGRKRVFVILAKNNERELLDALLRRCSVIKLPPMPPVLVYKTLLRRFESTNHDPKFLKFVSKVYEAIYNEQMSSNEELLSRLPALQELIAAISSDNELFINGVSSTRRINSLIRKLGKDDRSRKVITNILISKFRYNNQESNYNEALDIDMNSPEDYMSTRDADSLIEQYIEKKDSGEYIFEEDEQNDPMKDVASILENMKDDESLIFLEKENREKIVELGVISHQNPQALNILFDKIRFKGNPHSRFGFLAFEGDNFIGLTKYKNSLILIANKEYISPRLLMRGLSSIIRIIYDYRENVDYKNLIFSDVSAADFKLTGLNAKVLSKIPKMVLDKMTMEKGVYTFKDSNLKVTYDDSLDIGYFRYLQKYRSEPLFEAIERLCCFNPELALPAAIVRGRGYSCFVRGGGYSSYDERLFRKYLEFKKEKEKWEELKNDGWEVIIDDFPVINLSLLKPVFIEDYDENEVDYWEMEKMSVLDWNIDIDKENKKMHVYPKYQTKGDCVLYTSDSDFDNNEFIQTLSPLQREIAKMARSIFGNYIPTDYYEDSSTFFSYKTMSLINYLLENDRKIPGITSEPEFIQYYDSISQPSIVVSSEEALRKTM